MHLYSNIGAWKLTVLYRCVPAVSIISQNVFFGAIGGCAKMRDYMVLLSLYFYLLIYFYFSVPAT